VDRKNTFRKHQELWNFHRKSSWKWKHNRRRHLERWSVCWDVWGRWI